MVLSIVSTFCVNAEDWLLEWIEPEECLKELSGCKLGIYSYPQKRIDFTT